MFSQLKSLVFYCSMFIISANMMGFVAKDNRRRTFFYQIVAFLAFGIPIFMAALRSCGSDTLEYMMSYVRHTKLEWSVVFKGQGLLDELGHKLLLKLTGYFKSVRVFFGVYAALTVGFAYAAVKVLKKEELTLVMFLFLFGTFSSSMNVMRQGLAVAIIMYSFKFVLERDLKKFIITVLFATCFHTASIASLFIYFVWTKEGELPSVIILILGFAAALFMSLGLEGVFSFLSSIDMEGEMIDRFSVYSSSERTSLNRDFYLRIFVMVIVLLHYKKLVVLDKRNGFFIYLMLISVALGACGFISPFAKRIASFFSCAQYFVLPDIPRTYEDSQGARTARVGIVLYTLGKFTLTYFFLRQSNLIPYIWVLPSWAEF